jgi:hypothetical protein
LFGWVVVATFIVLFLSTGGKKSQSNDVNIRKDGPQKSPAATQNVPIYPIPSSIVGAPVTRPSPTVAVPVRPRPTAAAPVQRTYPTVSSGTTNEESMESVLEDASEEIEATERQKLDEEASEVKDNLQVGECHPCWSQTLVPFLLDGQ